MTLGFQKSSMAETGSLSLGLGLLQGSCLGLLSVPIWWELAPLVHPLARLLTSSRSVTLSSLPTFQTDTQVQLDTQELRGTLAPKLGQISAYKPWNKTSSVQTPCPQS